MPKKEEKGQSPNGNGLRDYSHLPRAKDFKKPEKLTELQKIVKKSDSRIFAGVGRRRTKICNIHYLIHLFSQPTKSKLTKILMLFIFQVWFCMS
jgi:hypothetical protein